MKALKIVFASMALPALLIALSSFASKNYDAKAFARVCYTFTSSANRVAPGSGDSINNTGGTTGATSFTNVNNWSSFGSTPPQDCQGGELVCAICFDNPPYSLQQAINIAWNTYNGRNPKTFTQGEDVDPSGTQVINIYLKED